MGGAAISRSNLQMPEMPARMVEAWDAMPFEEVVLKAVSLITPSYFIEDVKICTEELDKAYSMWRLIIFNKTCHFQTLTSAVQSALSTRGSAGFFIFSFDEHLFEVANTDNNHKHFKAAKIQLGSAIFSLITFCFDFWFDESKWSETMTHFSQLVHSQGIKASAYGLIGQVLFDTLKQCSGDLYTDATHNSWVKFYSRILNHILPTALGYEMICDKLDRSSKLPSIRQQRSVDTEDDEMSMISLSDD
jgi:hemoglobin-like flavoprotein